jgi:hypothetical protein
MITISPGFCSVTPIRLYEKQNKTIVSFDTTPYYTTGSKREDGLVSMRLISGTMTIDDIVITVPQPILK